MEQIIEQAKSYFKAIVEDGELFKYIAKAQRQHYIALIEAGFTESEALQLSIASANSMKPQ